MKEANKGSPPLARGTVIHPHPLKAHHRITPACAGNSMQNSAVLRCLRDHPRLRGEQVHMFDLHRHTQGSPPLARGTVLDGQKVYDSVGITPACAGNSKSDAEFFMHIRDHPRLRGEQYRRAFR